MASAQVLPNSRKLGHLEAGKKKLEEFRKKKSEGRAKKASSTGGESKAVNSSQTTEIHPSSRRHGSSPLLVDSNHASYGESVQNSGKEVPELYESSGFPELVNGFYDQWKGNNELSRKKETNAEPPDGSTPEQFDVFNPVKANSNIDMNSTSSFHSSFNPSHGDDRNSLMVPIRHPDTSLSNSLRTCESPDGVPWQSRLGNPSTSSNTSALHKESSLEAVPTGILYKNSATDFGIGGGRIVDSIDHNLDVDSARWHASEPSYKDSSLAYKGTQFEYPYASTGFGTSSGRSRPSFLDSLGVSRFSSMGYVPHGQPEKASTSGSFDDSKVQSTEAPLSASQQPFVEFNSVGQSLQSTTTNFKSDNELSMNIIVSSNDETMLNSAGDHHAQRDNDSFTSKKDEGFAALEQHIEDLTQEKFSLQRALETSRTLAESLASENSSLTESYNQQGKIISQLKSDMDRLQEEIKGQLSVFESMRSVYMNAQLECNAADERAKILASEIIGLEEKALRLRSNELKLEKQLKNLNSEIASYKRKVSILEKEHQDFQSTIDALQEEKKLMQSKLRKVYTGGKVDAKKTSTRRDISTSTDDLGGESLNLVDGEASIADRMLISTINPFQDSMLVVSSADASTSSLGPENRPFAFLDASGDIPHDQLGMIENINSVISELALEKEDLVGALKTESSNCAKLKDLNKDLSHKLEAQTQRLELLTAQRMANESVLTRPIDTHRVQETIEYADEGDEVVERVLGWIMKLFPGGPSKRRTSKLL